MYARTVSQIFWHSVLGREPVVVLDAPLLFESKADLLCKHTVVVHCSETTQVMMMMIMIRVLHISTL